MLLETTQTSGADLPASTGDFTKVREKADVYFSADVETDGPIPGPYSMLSFAIVYAGRFDGSKFVRPNEYNNVFYRELKPISNNFEQEALDINGLNRDRLRLTGTHPEDAMSDAADWVRSIAGQDSPVLVAYPLSFDWTWLYWYFVSFSQSKSPFSFSSCLDIKTAYAIRARIPISWAGREGLPGPLRSERKNTHNAVDDAVAQAEVFANVLQWDGSDGITR